MKIYKSLILAIAAATIPAITSARELATTSPQYGFAHPGILHTSDDFARIKRQLDENNTQVKAAYNVLINSEYSKSTVISTPLETIVRGGGTGENYITAARAATMAYQNALRWKLDGTTANADKAVEILNAWAATTKEITGDSNYALAAGLYGYQFANAAELMRDYKGWADADFRAFQQWMLDLWYPSCLGFLTQRNGTWENGSYASNGERPGHYWSNWGLCNALTLMSIGVLCDDPYVYNQGVSFYKYDQVGNFNVPYPSGYLTNRGCNEFIGNLVPKVYDDARGPLGQLGQMQESGRDQGHALLAVGLAVDICQVAWNQGDDLFGYMDNRLLAGIEYVAAYNFVDDIDLPWTEYHYANRGTSWSNADVESQISSDSRGGIRPFWARVIGHYEGIKGLTLNYSEIALSQMGIDGGGKGSVSGGYDHPGYTVLTCTQDGKAAKAPTPLSPVIVYGGNEIQKSELGGTTNNYSYQEPEIAAGQTITLKAVLPAGEINTGNWLWDNGETGQELTFTAHRACVRKVEYTNADGVKSYQMFTIASLDDGYDIPSGINYTFTDGVIPTEITISNNSDTSIINGNLHVEMGLSDATKREYRGDIQIVPTKESVLTLNPKFDKYLAVKFNGAMPNGKMTLEFNDGSRWYNTKWKDNSNRATLSDGNGNTIVYFDLTKDTDYANGSAINVTRLNVKIPNNTNMSNYSVDWIKTFNSTDEINEYKNYQDDGADDYAVWNETTSTGYDNLLKAINEAKASGQNCTLTVHQNCQIIGNRAEITATELTIKGSDPKITITRDNTNNMFFLVKTTSSAKLRLQDLTLDGQNLTGTRMVEAANDGGGVQIENVTFRNLLGNKTGSAVYVRKNSTIKDCKFVNITNNADNNGIDKGVLFMAANGLTLQGNNTFENCGVNIYNDGNYDFTNTSTSHTTPINITVDPSKKLVGGKVVGNCHEPEKYVINNDGYCLLYNGKDNHLYLAEGYATTISDLGYATFYGDDNMTLTIPDGVEAYVCKVNEAKDCAIITQINDVIPAATAVLLYSDTPKLYQFVKSDEDASAITNNDLKGSATAIELNGSDADYYLLTREGDNPVFKHVGAATTVTSAAHKAYIELPRILNRAPALRITKNESTSGVESILETVEDEDILYNVMGQKVNDAYKGFVIMGGKKRIQ